MSVPFGGPFPRFRADLASCDQVSSNEEQVAKREEREELSAVLGEATVAGLEIPELALDHPERMLDPRPHHGDDPVDVRVDGVKRTAFRGLAHDAPELARAQNSPGPENAASRAALT